MIKKYLLSMIVFLGFGLLQASQPPTRPTSPDNQVSHTGGPFVGTKHPAYGMTQAELNALRATVEAQGAANRRKEKQPRPV